jgi:transposase
VDETGWFEGFKRSWLWVAVTTTVTVFLVAKHRSYEAAKTLLGSFAGVVVSDRAKAYLPLKLRQLCWAHLLRDFEAMVERGGACAQVGGLLVAAAQALFHIWHNARDGTYSQSYYRARMTLLRKQVHQHLQQGVEQAGPKTAATCQELLGLEPYLWTFVTHPEVEPTNNAAERAERGAVLWRKGSFGTQSDRGSRFVERMLTVVMTLRQQRRNVLEFLTEALSSHRAGLPAPSLLPCAQAAA